MNPNLYYNRGIGRSLSGNTNQETDEYDEENENDYGHDGGESNRYQSNNRHGGGGKYGREHTRESHQYQQHQYPQQNRHFQYQQQQGRPNPLFRHLKLV